MSEDDNNKSTCHTYFPPTMAALAATTGAIEGFAFGGPVAAVMSATLQGAGGYKLGELACDFVDHETKTPGSTPQMAGQNVELASNQDQALKR